jgi:fructose-1,6-bisphosphatase-3
MNNDGSFVEISNADGSFSGRSLMDYLNQMCIDAYFLDEVTDPVRKRKAVDLMWYLWCGKNSPLFGKDKITTFEHYFVDDKAACKETFNAYYSYTDNKEYVEKILNEFGLGCAGSHIINGHVPVEVKNGESPVKAGGKLYVIDGGLSKAYHEKTGIAGYTLICNSHHLALAVHRSFTPGQEYTPRIVSTEEFEKRVMVRDTDVGRELKKQIDDLKELMEAYKNGLIKEK